MIAQRMTRFRWCCQTISFAVTSPSGSLLSPFLYKSPTKGQWHQNALFRRVFVTEHTVQALQLFKRHAEQSGVSGMEASAAVKVIISWSYKVSNFNIWVEIVKDLPVTNICFSSCLGHGPFLTECCSSSLSDLPGPLWSLLVELCSTP